MKTTFKMKEATNAEEAIISILDVLEENPLWLNKCTSSLAVVMKKWYNTPDEESKEFAISSLKNFPKDCVIALFTEYKKEYYHFKDFTQWNY
jgi:hypothetical protein